MPKSLNSLLSAALVLILIFQVFIPFPLSAETLPTDSQQPKITLEQAIKTVKDSFEVPEALKEFTSGFSRYNNRESWSLSWSSTENSERFSAQVDAASGEIINIYASKSSAGKQDYQLPAHSLAEAKEIANNTVKKLTGEKYAKLKFVENDNIIPLDLYGSPTYAFSWERIENGIAVQGNGARTQIDANTGQVSVYSLTWDTLNLPQAEKVIDAEQAVQAFSQHKMLEIQYFLPSIFRPLTAENIKEQVQLVYQLNQNSLIDAFTGNPLKLTPNAYLASDLFTLGKMGSGMAESALSKSVPLTPQEQREVEQNTKLVTKEEAIKVIQKWVQIPSDFSLTTMNLNTDSSLRDTKVWYFEWASPDQERSQNITARVDAINGELIGFNCYNSRLPLTGNTEQNTTLTKNQAQTLAEEFLQKIQPAKFTQVKLKADPTDQASPTTKDAISIPTPEDTSASFNYERIVNGIVFPSNGMNVTVDLTTKKITAYHLNWYNLDFPTLSQTLSQAEAATTFLKARPMVLKYVLVYNGSGLTEAKLAYQPQSDGNQISDIIDAKTGVFLDWQGEVLNTQPRSYHFTDIAGHDAEKEITVLGQAGMFGEYNDVFKPTENLTAASLFRALLSIQNGTGDYRLSAEELLKKAKDQGWLKETITPSQSVSRELFSKIIVRYLGLEKIAELKDIYTSSFMDTNQSQGYIALTTGLGIIKTNGQNFEPNKNFTRAEAARSIIIALENRL